MASDNYVLGPLVLVKPSVELPPGALTVSHCLGVVAPDAWAIEWVAMDGAERCADAARCGISEERLPDVIAWVCEQFDRTFAWPHVFLNLAAAQECRRRFLPEAFRLLQTALPEELVSSFLSLAAPPLRQPDYAPMGETGAYQAVFRREHDLPSAERRGFEILGYDRYGGGFHSFRCFDFTKDFADLGVSFNRWGLIDDEDQALRCAELANRPENRSCPDAWHSWLILEHRA
jgi:hypothetical protein